MKSSAHRLTPSLDEGKVGIMAGSCGRGDSLHGRKDHKTRSAQSGQIKNKLREIWVLERLGRCDSLLGIVLKQAREQFESIVRQIGAGRVMNDAREFLPQF